MNKSNSFFTCSVLLFLILISCTGKDTRVTPEEFIPESISELGLDRSAEVLVFRGDSLTYYTNEAQFIQRFNFIDMASADYTGDDIVLEVEIYRFASPEDAYGYYSHVRWGNSDKTFPIGVEGFRSLPNVYFVKGPYVVHTMGFDDSEKPARALDDLAAYYADEIPGDNTMPDRFALFPSEGTVPSSAMYFPNAFLGIDFMKCVYSSYQKIDTDTVFLFLACDSAEAMFLQWSKIAEADSTIRPLPEDIPYDEDKGFIIEHQRYGRVIIGIKNDIMTAMMGYDERHKQFMNDWINSLPEKVG